MGAFTAMLVALGIFEYVAWLSPAKGIFQKWSSKYFYSCNPYYVPRIAILAVILLLFRPNLWFPFAGSINWLYSLGMGIVLCLLCLANPQLRGYGKAGLWERIRTAHKSDPIRFWKTTAYIIVYTGLIEELIFRWFFVAVLQPYLSWWVVLVEPFICTVWHYPVIISQPWMYMDNRKLNWHGLFGWSSQAFAIGLLLTIVSITTHNISGAVLAHSFSNWLSIVNEQQ